MDIRETLRDRAERLARQAREIVTELDLVGRWAVVGEPVLVGAQTAGLMVARDIDMEVYSESPTPEQGFGVMAGVAALPGVVQVRFINALDTPDAGLYWGVEYRDREGETWKVDCWHVDHSHPDAHLAERFAEAMRRALTDETRDAILRLKEESRRTEKLPGIDIYRAVLQGGARTLDDLVRWLKNNRTEGVTHWLPGS